MMRLIEPRIELSPTGMKLPDDLSYEQWQEVGKILKAVGIPEAA